MLHGTSSMLVFENSNQKHIELLKRFDSQFEYEWKNSKIKEELMKTDSSGNQVIA